MLWLPSLHQLHHFAVLGLRGVGGLLLLLLLLLLQACVRARRLETAASYLMVVQALQSAEETRQQTLDLLHLCLADRKWSLSQDLIRFYKATSEAGDDSAQRDVCTVVVARGLW